MRTHAAARRRSGAVWTQDEDARLLRIADLPPREIAAGMARSWDACRRRLRYLRAGASNPHAELSATTAAPDGQR